MLLCKKFGLDPIKVSLSVMEITRTFDEKILRAAWLIRKGIGGFDAYHDSFSEGEIISSDHVYDNLGIKRIRLEDPSFF
ncbi:hypothetical protein [Acidianus brierleyi]|uniref:hypothetical protein n=1 Tax=Acidianus brierleyi TaxID=41673 RepID=UPI001FE2484D|nr:hypothetical protein [Acidianus brierleyi]